MRHGINEASFRDREAWLNRAAVELADLIAASGYTPTAPYLSVGLPLGSRKAIGQAWTGARSADGRGHIFICPSLADPVTVLSTLLHELGHDIVGAEHKHGKPFADFCKAVGLLAPWTATTPSPELRETLNLMVIRLGDYPHAALDKELRAKPKQAARLRKYVCPGCEQVLRAATDTLNAECVDCSELFTLAEVKDKQEA